MNNNRQSTEGALVISSLVRPCPSSLIMMVLLMILRNPPMIMISMVINDVQKISILLRKSQRIQRLKIHDTLSLQIIQTRSRPTTGGEAKNRAIEVGYNNPPSDQHHHRHEELVVVKMYKEGTWSTTIRE